MSQIQKFIFTLGANEEINPSIPVSDFIGCTSSSTTFTVSPSDLSPLVLENGLSVKLNKTFNTLRIKNGSVAQTIELYVGQGELKDARLALSGGLPISGNAGASYGAVSVGTTAIAIQGADSSRASCLIQNLGGSDLWIGTDASVTALNGIKIGGGGSATITFQSAIFGIAGSGTLDVRYLNEVA